MRSYANPVHNGLSVVTAAPSTPTSSSTRLYNAVSRDALATTRTQISDSVGSILAPDFPRARIGDSVADAAAQMTFYNRGGLLVFDEQNDLIGIFTERDYLRKIVDGGASAITTKIEEVMTGKDKLKLVESNESINNCRLVMAEARVRHLPVVNSKGQVVGLVGMRDVINVMNQDQVVTAKLFGATMTDVEEQVTIIFNLSHCPHQHPALNCTHHSSQQPHSTRGAHPHTALTRILTDHIFSFYLNASSNTPTPCSPI
jgi:CBS domain-containing protein